MRARAHARFARARAHAGRCAETGGAQPRRAGWRRETSLLCVPWSPRGPATVACSPVLPPLAAPSERRTRNRPREDTRRRPPYAADLVHVAQQLPAVFKALRLTSEFLSIKVDCADRGFGDRGMAALCEALVAIRRPRMQARLLFYKLNLTDASMPHVRLPPPRCLPDCRCDPVRCLIGGAKGLLVRILCLHAAMRVPVFCLAHRCTCACR